MMQRNWWDQYEQVAPEASTAPQPSTPGYIPGVPDQASPLELRQEARRDATAERQAAASERQANNADRLATNDDRRYRREDFDAQAKLRGEFEGRADTKRFATVRTAREQIRSLVNAPNTTAQDDIAMIFSFMRALDPNSVVREGEFATAQNSAGVPEQIQNYYNRALSGERLSTQQRRNFGQTVDTLYQRERDLYNQQALRYRELAERQGIDPDVVARRYVPDAPAEGQGSPFQREAKALTPENLVDLAVGLNGGQYDITRDGELTYNGQPVAADDSVLNSDEVREAYRRKFGVLPPLQVSINGEQGSDNTPLAGELDKAGRRDSVADPFVRGVADTVTLGLSDEIAAAGQTIFGDGTMRENLARERGIAGYDEQYNFLPRLTGQIAGGFALPVGGATTPGRLAAVGAGYGAGYGFGSADGSLADRLSGAVSGGVVGGGLGFAGGTIAQRLASRGGGGGGGNAAGREVYQAAQDAGIVDPGTGRSLVLPADVAGPMTRRLTAGMEQSPFGSGPIRRAAERGQNRAGERLTEIASAEGAPVRQEALGELGQNAAQGYIDRTGAAATRAYDGARELAGDTLVQGRRAFQNLNSQIRELAPTAPVDGPVISGLERLRNVIANEGGLNSLSVDAIRRLRTATAAEARVEGLRGTDYQRRANLVLNDLSEDIASQLPDEAAAAFRAADRAYAERLNTIDDVMTQVVGQNGDRSAEAVANRLIGLSRGDSARLRTFLNAVEPEEAGIIRGSLIQEMGRSTPGQQTAAGDGFSLSTFLTNWDKMPVRTRDTLFRGEHRQAIEALARYAQGVRGTRSYTNTSNTAGAANAASIGRSAMSGAGAVASLGGTAVLENLTGRLLGSRRFAQWLARAPRDPSQTGAWARRLSVIASREPALAPDIAPLQAALSQSPGRAAAQDEQN